MTTRRGRQRDEQLDQVHAGLKENVRLLSLVAKNLEALALKLDELGLMDVKSENSGKIGPPPS